MALSRRLVLAFVAISWSGAARAADGVVSAPEAVVRSAPFEVAPELARLHAGDKVWADDNPSGAWRRVRLPDGRIGLVHDADLQVVAAAAPAAGETAPATPPPAPVVAAAPPPPPASPFGAAGQVVLSTERLFGYVHSSQTHKVAGVDQTETIDSFALLGDPFSIPTLYSSPRLALDYFMIDRLSVGASATYFHISDDVPGSTSSVTFSGFLVAPRLGYALPLASAVSVWPRVGVTFTKFSIETSGVPSQDRTAFALTLEAPFVFTVTSHVFLSLAPTFDLGLAGSVPNTASSGTTDQTVTNFGIEAALGAFF
jgi:hypothetical protein